MKPHENKLFNNMRLGMIRATSYCWWSGMICCVLENSMVWTTAYIVVRHHSSKSHTFHAILSTKVRIISNSYENDYDTSVCRKQIELETKKIIHNNTAFT